MGDAARDGAVDGPREEGPRDGDGEERQRSLYLQGHRRNPLTTTPLGARVLSASQLLWFMLAPPSGFGVLTTIGRRTGKRRHRCVRAVEAEGTVYLVSLRGPYAAWMRNIEADPRVQIRLRGGRLVGTARVIADPAELRKAQEAYCGTVNRLDFTEYRLHRSGRPTPGGIRQLHEHWFTVGTPLAIDVDERSDRERRCRL